MIVQYMYRRFGGDNARKDAWEYMRRMDARGIRAGYPRWLAEGVYEVATVEE